jgi:hypothetical protein
MVVVLETQVEQKTLDLTVMVVVAEERDHLLVTTKQE